MMNNIPPRLKCEFFCEQDFLKRAVILHLGAAVDEYALKDYLGARFSAPFDSTTLLGKDQWGFGYMVLKALVEAEKDRINFEDPPDYKVISETRAYELSQLREKAEDIAGFKLDRTENDYTALHGYLNYLESRVNKLEGRETAPGGG